MTPEEIKALRKSLGLTQADMAKLVGAAHKITIAQWEGGKRKPDRWFQFQLEKLQKKGIEDLQDN